MNNTPPKPRLSLAVGIIGHRPNRLPEAARDKVATDVANVLEQLSAETKIAYGTYNGFFAPASPLLSLVSALAEGSDRIAAEAGLALGWVVDVVLPFPAAVYRTDFETPESKSTFDDFLRRARSVLALPGQRQNAMAAYEAVGLTVLGQSDILLAVWDHGASAGVGGTTEMLEAAVRLGIPIIHVDANGKVPPRVLWGELNDFPVPVEALDQLPIKDIDSGLKVLIEKIVQPPTSETELHALKRYLGERFPGYNLRPEFPILMTVCGVRATRKADWRPVNPQSLAEELLKLGSSSRSETPSEPAVLALAYGWADAVANRFAHVFRSAFVTNFLFASVAVVVATMSLLFEHDKKHIFVSIELLLIVVVLGNTIVGRWRAWHQRWFEPREVAERLRIALALWTLGARPKSFLGQEPAWTGWYARAIVREQRLRSSVLDSDGLAAARVVLLAVLADQCNYHHATAARMGKLERRLEGFGLILFGATVLTAIIFLVVAHFVDVPNTAAFLVTVLAAGLPALATASYGIRVIGDFEGIARRSERTHDVLKELIEAVGHDPLNLDLLRARARSAAEAMLGDVSSWRIAAESRRLNIPG